MEKTRTEYLREGGIQPGCLSKIAITGASAPMAAAFLGRRKK